MSEQIELPIHKLPKWAQEHITKIERERDTAIGALRGFVDNQTESRVYYNDFACIGESRGPSIMRNYIQSDRVTFVNAGVELSVSITDKEIQLSWGAENRASGAVGLIPKAFMQASLIAKEHMR